MILEFEGAARCALVQAFARNVQSIYKWGDVLPMNYLRMIMNIPSGIHRCTLDNQSRPIYRAFALAERDRLATCGNDHGLICAHTVIEHRNALDVLLKQLVRQPMN